MIHGRLSIIFLLLILQLPLTFGQEMPNYSRVELDLSEISINDLPELYGMLSEAYWKDEQTPVLEISEYEVDLLQSHKVPMRVLIQDLSQYYLEVNSMPAEEAMRGSGGIFCREKKCIWEKSSGNDPSNFFLGSMGGYPRLVEIYEDFERMHQTFPQLFGEQTQINNFSTVRGRNLWYYKMTNNPSVNHPNRPKILITALHHAREAITISQMQYFIWYLLESYDKDPISKYIIDNVEIYFVPVVNPDGYRFNENHFFEGHGFGMHRKNMKDVMLDGGSFTTGVDLNRNYDFQFGADEIGSSGNPFLDTYRGSHPFSERETQAIKWMCENIDFDLALNYHSFGEMILVPFGDQNLINPESFEFYEIGKTLANCNEYEVGEPFKILYPTNGTADDWMYGNTDGKKAIYAFTPEVGHPDMGFYPPQSMIKPLCRDMLSTNIMAALSVLNYAEVQNMTHSLFDDKNASVNVLVKRIGLQSGYYTLMFEPLSNLVTSQLQEQSIHIDPFSSREVQFDIQFRPDIDNFKGEEISYVIHLDNGSFIETDTFSSIYQGYSEVIFEERAIDMDNWVANGNSTWGLDNMNFFTPPFAISDSPNEAYDGQAPNTIQLIEPIDLSTADAAYLTFRAKWEMDFIRDRVQLSISENGITGWTPVCGQFTQDYISPSFMNEPVFTGIQNQWVLESIDLSDYIGSQIFLQWRMSTDFGNRSDHYGFTFDDMEVVIFRTPTSVKPEHDASVKIYPNPAHSFIHVDITSVSEVNEPIAFELRNALGQVVLREMVQDNSRQTLQLNHLPAGMYFYRLSAKESVLDSNSLIIH